MQTVVLTIHLLLALALILVVLLQRSEGGGLGIGGGGIMTSRGAATALSKVTWLLGSAFVVTSVALTVIAARESGADSVIDRLGGGEAEAPAGGPATPPALGDDLLPPVPAEGPTTPPAEGPATPPPAD